MSKKIFSNYHLDTYQTDRGFIYAQRRNVNSTAALCFKKEEDGSYSFLIRYQPLPEIKLKDHNYTYKNLYPCCITGSLEINETPTDNVIKEVWEESGYTITKENIKEVIKATSSTQMNEVVFNFLIDLTNKTNEKPTNDGSFFEEISENKWISESNLKDILLKNSELYLSSLSTAYLLFLKHINKI